MLLLNIGRSTPKPVRNIHNHTDLRVESPSHFFLHYHHYTDILKILFHESQLADGKISQ